jgi:hypothetical protein
MYPPRILSDEEGIPPLKILGIILLTLDLDLDFDYSDLHGNLEQNFAEVSAKDPFRQKVLIVPVQYD